MMDHVPTGHHHNFIESSDEDQQDRVLLPAHSTTDQGGAHYVFPAGGLFLGTIVDMESGENRVAVMRMRSAHHPWALAFCPSTTELRTLAKSMLSIADELEGDAQAAAAAALDKAMKGSRNG